MNILDIIYTIGDWILSNIASIIFSAISLVGVYIVNKIFAREIRVLKDRQQLEEHIAYMITRIGKWVAFLVAISIILAQFGVTFSVISGLLTLLGGTIIGFAAVNTIGNAIAGIIVMTSRPFRVGDRIFFKGQFADVTAIELIYTKMITLDNVLVSVPNQELLKEEIADYGKDRVIRRRVTVTPGFEYDSELVEKALLEAVNEVPEVLKEPEPYVWITNFQNFAVEYNLYIFTNEVKSMMKVDAKLYDGVLKTCKKYDIDISTPTLIQQVKK